MSTYVKYAVDKITMKTELYIKGRKVELEIQESIFVYENDDRKLLHKRTVDSIIDKFDSYESGKPVLEDPPVGFGEVKNLQPSGVDLFLNKDKDDDNNSDFDLF